jgi:hypothetical protein
MIAFHCPGCETRHAISTKRWTFNGDGDKPTFSPSILVRTGTQVDPAYIRKAGDPPTRCHSFVRDGRIQFLSDCDHALAGKTVELPSINGQE